MRKLQIIWQQSISLYLSQVDSSVQWTLLSEPQGVPAKQEAGVQSLVGGDPLEKEMATHSSILAWRSPWTEEPRGLQSMGYNPKSQTRLSD